MMLTMPGRPWSHVDLNATPLRIMVRRSDRAGGDTKRCVVTQRRKAMTPAGLSWPVTRWGYVDLNHGPLPYQGADLAVLVALLGL